MEYSYGAKAAVLSCIRPVADAQFEKAAKPVTISEGDAIVMFYQIMDNANLAPVGLFNWLRSKGVEVVP